jgi:hypothetical protein
MAFVRIVVYFQVTLHSQEKTAVALRVVCGSGSGQYTLMFVQETTSKRRVSREKTIWKCRKDMPPVIDGDLVDLTIHHSLRKERTSNLSPTFMGIIESSAFAGGVLPSITIMRWICKRYDQQSTIWVTSNTGLRDNATVEVLRRVGDV